MIDIDWYNLCEIKKENLTYYKEREVQVVVCSSSSDELMSFLKRNLAFIPWCFLELSCLIPRSGELLMLPKENVTLWLLLIDLFVFLLRYRFSFWAITILLTFSSIVYCLLSYSVICEWMFFSCISFITFLVSWSLLRSAYFFIVFPPCRFIRDTRSLIFYWKYSHTGSYFSAK